ncbi:hypothetical protein ACFPMF_27745 [Larkinella bovis]|uniref:Uncharacterized protein n=1 Tax=Larkinella bovis TaxID=683041 RepID=A0ABW0IL18_9BACT
MALSQSQRFQRINDQLRRGLAVPPTELMRLCETAERTLKEDLAQMRERYGAPITDDWEVTSILNPST